jgi:hypothetical protein
VWLLINRSQVLLLLWVVCVAVFSCFELSMNRAFLFIQFHCSFWLALQYAVSQRSNGARRVGQAAP